MAVGPYLVEGERESILGLDHWALARPLSLLNIITSHNLRLRGGRRQWLEVDKMSVPGPQWQEGLALPHPDTSATA